MPAFAQVLPGMEAMATRLMQERDETKGVGSLGELRALRIQAGVEFIARQITVDLFDFAASDFIQEIDLGGAATFIEFAADADARLYI